MPWPISAARAWAARAALRREHEDAAALLGRREHQLIAEIFLVIVRVAIGSRVSKDELPSTSVSSASANPGRRPAACVSRMHARQFARRPAQEHFICRLHDAIRQRRAELRRLFRVHEQVPEPLLALHRELNRLMPVDRIGDRIELIEQALLGKRNVTRITAMVQHAEIGQYV